MINTPKPKYTIYPDVRERELPHQDYYECETYLRVFHKGKHYLWRHRQMGELRDKVGLLDVLHKSVYLTMKFGEPDPELRYSDGTLALVLHDNQELERTRLIKRYQMESL